MGVEGLSLMPTFLLNSHYCFCRWGDSQWACFPTSECTFRAYENRNIEHLKITVSKFLHAENFGNEIPSVDSHVLDEDGVSWIPRSWWYPGNL